MISKENGRTGLLRRIIMYKGSNFFIFLHFIFAINLFANNNSDIVSEKEGLIAFWNFDKLNNSGVFTAYSNIEAISENPFPLYLRSRKKPNEMYSTKTWPYESVFQDSTGPFGNAIKIDRGYTYATCVRSDFENTPLNIYGKQPFTLITWIKFFGTSRHHIVGIWEEGENNENKRYNGKRQFALFWLNKFPNKVFGHISATGAASFPQSNASGSIYARIRAVNGTQLENGKWYAIALTYDGEKATCFVNGDATNYYYEDGVENVEEDVYGDAFNPLTNPKDFTWGVYEPRNFIVKFNGYSIKTGSFYEQFVCVDLLNENPSITYGFKAPDSLSHGSNYHVSYHFERNGDTITGSSGSFKISYDGNGRSSINSSLKIQAGDILNVSLFNGDKRVGTEIKRTIEDGAPFSLGWIQSKIVNGNQGYYDGVAVFNRVLNEKEIHELSFNNSGQVTKSFQKSKPKSKVALLKSKRFYKLLILDEGILTIYSVSGRQVLRINPTEKGEYFLYKSQLNSGTYLYKCGLQSGLFSLN